MKISSLTIYLEYNLSRCGLSESSDGTFKSQSFPGVQMPLAWTELRAMGDHRGWWKMLSLTWRLWAPVLTPVRPWIEHSHRPPVLWWAWKEPNESVDAKPLYNTERDKHLWEARVTPARDRRCAAESLKIYLEQNKHASPSGPQVLSQASEMVSLITPFYSTKFCIALGMQI